MKIFVLGRTGSGKSTTIRFLARKASSLGWSTVYFNDYPILKRMCLTDTEQKFRRTAHDGFEVLDMPVYDTALQRLARHVQNFRPPDEHTVIFIEFSRDDYFKELRAFEPEYLQDAFFLFVAADLLLCLERVDKRGVNPLTEDDYFVLDTVLLKHFPRASVPPSIFGQKVFMLPNMDSLNALQYKVNMLSLSLFEQAPACLLATSGHS